VTVERRVADFTPVDAELDLLRGGVAEMISGS